MPARSPKGRPPAGPRRGDGSRRPRPAANRARRGQTGTTASPEPSPELAESSALRRSVSRVSAPVLRVLSRQPRWLVGVALLALLIAGLIVAGIGGAVLLLVVAAVTAWLGYLSWPLVAGAGQRAMRVLVTLALIGYAAYKIAAG